MNKLDSLDRNLDNYEIIINKLAELRELDSKSEPSGAFRIRCSDLSALEVDPASDRELEELLNLPYSAMSSIEIEKVVDYKANLRAYGLYLEMLKADDPDELDSYAAIAAIMDSAGKDSPYAEYTEVD